MGNRREVSSVSSGDERKDSSRLKSTYEAMVSIEAKVPAALGALNNIIHLLDALNNLLEGRL